jgi:hypothetical protein
LLIMGHWPVIAGWVLALVLAAAAASSAVRVRGNWRDPGAWAVPLPFACLAVIALTVLGVLAPLTGGLLAGILAAAEGVFLWRGDDKPMYAFADHLGGGLRHLYADARSLASRARPGAPAEPVRPASAPGAGPAPAGGSRQAPDAPAARKVPSIREDADLGPAPAPAEVAASAEVPLPFAELASWIAQFEPEDDVQQTWFIRGSGAGLVAVAEALAAHADTVVNAVGLDPSYGQAILELADLIAELASDAGQVDKRYHVIYDAVKQAVDNGLILPHRTREWFSGHGESAA